MVDMKRIFTTLSILLFLLVASSFTTVSAQHYYVIVGTFTKENNAKKFMGYVNSKLYNANYESNVTRKYFHVYILKTTNRDEAVAETRRLQSETEFKDAWLFNGKYDENGKPIAVNIQEAKPAEEPATPITKPDTIVTIAPVDTAVVVKPDLPDAPPAEPVIVRGKLVKFALQNTEGKPIQGEVHSVDFQRGLDLAVYRSNQYIDLMNPGRDRNPMALVCGIFGYKEVIKVMDYNDPSLTEGALKDNKGAWVIPYRLERMRKGDVSVMYHVAFYKDAVIMLPPAKAELDELVAMMRDNPNYKIKIHGHCNGSHSRRIIGLGPTKSYFDVKGSSEHVGSAKELSRQRAEAVQTYLGDHGIDKARCQIFAWGALNMLVPENSNSARLNDRIEIEIQQD